MRRFLIATCTGIGLLAVGAIAHGQAPQPSPNQPSNEKMDQRLAPTSKINLTLEQEHVIKEVVKDLQLDPAPANAPETVGASVAEGTTLRPMPDLVASKVPQIRSHRFFVKAQKIFIVDPKDNSIVQVID